MIYIIILTISLTLIFRNNIIINLIIAYLIIVILFINVNPYDINQNKLSILKNIPEKYTSKIGKLNDINVNIIKYPFVVKPIICSRVSKDVYVVKSKDELIKILNDIKDKDEFMYQSFIPFENEVGILYERNLFNNKGKIISIVKKSSKDFSVMASCSGNVSCDDITDLVTPKLTKVICEIADSIPNFNVGRFDIKYKDEKSLLLGEDFYILEANGTMGFDLRKSINKYSIFKKGLYINQWFIYRVLYGIKNIITFNGYNIFMQIVILIKTFTNFIKCDDWEKIFALYT